MLKRRARILVALLLATAGTGKDTAMAESSPGVRETSAAPFSGSLRAVVEETVDSSACPATVTVASLRQLGIEAATPFLRTGVGALSVMEVGPPNVDWSGATVFEEVTALSDGTCPVGWADFACVGNKSFLVNDIRSGYSGMTTFLIDQDSCDAPSPINTSAEMKLEEQQGNSFSGRVTNTTTFDGALFVEEMDLVGTVSLGQGELDLTGTYEERLFLGGETEAGSGGEGEFAGSYDGSSLTFMFSGEDTYGATCRISGTTELTGDPDLLLRRKSGNEPQISVSADFQRPPNTFLDVHHLFGVDSLLHDRDLSDCSLQCRQIYKCGDQEIGSFVIEYFFSRSTAVDPQGGETVPVTRVRADKTGDAQLRAPSRLKVKVLGPNRLRLKWRDRSKGESGFQVQMRKEGKKKFKRVASLSANTRKVVLTGLKPDTTYTFRVRAVARGRNSAFGPEVSATTDPED